MRRHSLFVVYNYSVILSFICLSEWIVESYRIMISWPARTDYVEIRRNFMESKIKKKIMKQIGNSGVWFQQESNSRAHNEKLNRGFEWVDICYILEDLHKGLFSLGLPKFLQTSTNNNWWLKAALRQAITGISLEMSRRIMEDFRNRLQLCMKAKTWKITFSKYKLLLLLRVKHAKMMMLVQKYTNSNIPIPVL